MGNMEPVRPLPDDRVPARHVASLGGDVGRWIREADDRLASLDVRAPGVPRADDFGHVTPEAAPRAASPAPREPAPAPERGPTAGGIVVAAGWGGRPRA